MKVTKGMRVSTLNFDNTISTGKVIGVGYAKYYHDDVTMEQTAHVVFDDFQGHCHTPDEGAWFTDMYSRDLNPIGHVYHEQCACGSLLSMCHPHA